MRLTKMLIVAKDELVLDVYQGLVSFFAPNISLDVSASPEDALEMFRSKKHAIVMSDVHAPLQSGVMLVTEACFHKKNVVIIFITADKTIIEENITPSLDGSCTYFVLHKPIDAKELRTVLMQALEVVWQKEAGGG